MRGLEVEYKIAVISCTRNSASACLKESGYAHLHTTHYIEREKPNCHLDESRVTYIQ